MIAKLTSLNGDYPFHDTVGVSLKLGGMVELQHDFGSSTLPASDAHSL